MANEELLQKRQMTLVREKDRREMCEKLFDFERGRVYETLISGGHLSDRTAMLLSLMRDARALSARGGRPEPVILLHQNDPYLVRSLCSDGNNVILPGRQRCKLDLLKGMSDDAVATVLYGTAKARYGYDSALSDLLEVGVELLRLRRSPVTLRRLRALPWHDLRNEVERLGEAGCLEGDDLLDVLGRADAAAKESSHANELLRDLITDLGQEQDPSSGCGLVQAMDRGGIVCLGLASNQQKTLTELYFQMFQLFARQGRRFLLVLDGVSLLEEGSDRRNMLIDKDAGFSWILSGDDLAATLGSDLSKFLGNVNRIVYAHNDAASAEAWSQHIGQTYQKKISTASGHTRDQTSLLGGQISRSVTQDMERRYKVLPEAIQKLKRGEALVQPGYPSSVISYIDMQHYLTTDPTGKMRLLRG